MVFMGKAGGTGEVSAEGSRQGLLSEKPVDLYRMYPSDEVIRKCKGFWGEGGLAVLI